MKILDIAFKDMTQSFRSLIAIMFMFVVPILMTGMFSLMFGGSTAEDEGISLPITKVILVNLDQGSFDSGMEMALPENLENNPEAANISSMGELLSTVLTSEGLADIMDVSLMDSVDAARKAVDEQQAGVAVIIPQNLTGALVDPNGVAEIELYQDPTLTIGPSVVKGVITQLLDNFSASKITLDVVLNQYIQNNPDIDQAQIQALVAQYLQTAIPAETASQSGADNAYLNIRAPKSEDAAADLNIIAMMMTGMTIFYVFFTGPSTAQSILREEERGTLQRLFTTPTPTRTIISGKFLATVFTILVQLTVLLLFGNLVFKIEWGALLPLILLVIVVTVAASAFGVFLISWMESERQAGFIMGGLVTIMGMAGMMPTFVVGMPNPPAFIKTISLFTPQGWAVEGFQKIMAGSSLNAVFPNLGVLLLWTAGFFLIGIIRFRNRFA